jgi:hypothetical protein
VLCKVNVSKCTTFAVIFKLIFLLDNMIFALRESCYSREGFLDEYFGRQERWHRIPLERPLLVLGHFLDAVIVNRIEFALKRGPWLAE